MKSCARLFNVDVLFKLLFIIELVKCQTVKKKDGEIKSKTKIQMNPLFITCNLNDTIIFKPSLLNINYTRYYLSKPNGDTSKITLKKSPHKGKKLLRLMMRERDDYSNDVLVFSNDDRAFYMDQMMQSDRIVFGPIVVADHGNWVFTSYLKDIDDQWVEIYQIISIEVVKFIQASPSNIVINEKEEFRLHFPYPLPNLESCNIVLPRFNDNVYREVDKTKVTSCGYVINNASVDDSGVWRLEGLGNLLYKTEIIVNVNK